MDKGKILIKALWVAVPLVAVLLIWLGIALVRGINVDVDWSKRVADASLEEFGLLVLVHALIAGSLASK